MGGEGAGGETDWGVAGSDGDVSGYCIKWSSRLIWIAFGDLLRLGEMPKSGDGAFSRALRTGLRGGVVAKFILRAGWGI